MYLTCGIFITTAVRNSHNSHNSHNSLIVFIILLQLWSFPASLSLSTVPAVSTPPRNYSLPSPSSPLVPNSFSPRNLCFICISSCFLLLPFIFLIEGFYIVQFSIFHSISSSLPLHLPIYSCTSLILYISESILRYHHPSFLVVPSFSP